jgi:hypothetical protein
MSGLPPSNQPVKTPFHWPSLIQLILSLLAAFTLFAAALVIVITAVFKFTNSGNISIDPTESFMLAASLAFAGVLVLPSAWYAWRNIAFPGQENPPRPERPGFVPILTIVVIFLEGVTLFLGNWASQNNQLTWLFLPPLNIIAAGLLALWVVYIGTHGLIPGMPQRRWGVFASGLVLGPLISLILELFLIVLVGILALLWVMLNPSLANQLNGLIFHLQNAGANLDTDLRLLIPFLLNPGIIFLGFAFISLLVPLLEELLKPIGVWFLAGQKLTPAQGFGYGVLSGTGFGLFENLGITSGGTADWALLASSRISTLLLHSFTAGLVGWALASAWSERHYLRLAIAYAVAVILHGLWNGLVVLSAATSLQGLSDISLPSALMRAGELAPYGIIVLGIVVLILYFAANALLRRDSPLMTSVTVQASSARLLPEPNQPAYPVSYSSRPSAEKSAPDALFPDADQTDAAHESELEEHRKNSVTGTNP